MVPVGDILAFGRFRDAAPDKRAVNVKFQAFALLILFRVCHGDQIAMTR